MMSKLDERKKCRSTTPPALAKYFVTRMETRQLFAAADLLLLFSILQPSCYYCVLNT